MTYKDKASYDSTLCTITGWRRPIGCLKLQVIFRKRATNYRALLRKMTCKDKASYDSTPPCTKYAQMIQVQHFVLENSSHRELVTQCL